MINIGGDQFRIIFEKLVDQIMTESPKDFDQPTRKQETFTLDITLNSYQMNTFFYFYNPGEKKKLKLENKNQYKPHKDYRVSDFQVQNNCVVKNQYRVNLVFSYKIFFDFFRENLNQ